MIVTVFGEVNESGLAPQWSQEKIMLGIGDVKLDLAKKPPAPEASLNVFRLIGDVRIKVPRGARVSMGGFTLIGDRSVNASGGDGPVVNLNVNGLIGDVEIEEI